MRRPIAQLVIRCGQHSLQIFCLGILLSVLGQIVLTSIRTDIPMQLAVDLAGVLLMVAIAELLTRYSASGARHSSTAAVTAGMSSVARRGNLGAIKRLVTAYSASWRSVS